MPYYRETLLSAFPDLVSDVGAPPPRYEPSMFDNMTAFEYGWYAPNTAGTLPNQVEDTRKDKNKNAQAIQAPKFLSERSRDAKSSQANSVDEIGQALHSSELASLGPEAPSMYRTVEIKFSKFGVDDFDFG